MERPPLKTYGESRSPVRSMPNFKCINLGLGVDLTRRVYVEVSTKITGCSN